MNVFLVRNVPVDIETNETKIIIKIAHVADDVISETRVQINKNKVLCLFLNIKIVLEIITLPTDL